MQARRQDARLEQALGEASDEAVRLRAERMSAFRELAKLKLDALARDGVVGELDAVEKRALAILEQARRSAAAYGTRRKQAEQTLDQLQEARDAKAAELDKALAALAELRSQIEADTRISADWATERGRIEELGRMAEQAERKAAQAQADRDEKRRPYEQDPLFMYLWERRYGAPDYSGGWFARFLDRRVARLVGYDKARANYAMLNAIPIRLCEHAARLRDELQGLRTRLKAIEREALDKGGATPLEARARAAKAALDAAERDLAEARAAFGKIEQEGRQGIASGEAAYAQAIELLAAADAAKDLRSLYREAIRTPDPRDEAVIKRIEATEGAIGRAEKQIGTIRREMEELGLRRRQIESERDEFRQRGYDDPFGTFGNERVLASVLGGIIGGVLQGTVLRDVFNEGYRRQPGPWDSDFGGDMPFPGGPGGGGDDGFTTGGGMGGDDGFRTGGSF